MLAEAQIKELIRSKHTHVNLVTESAIRLLHMNPELAIEKLRYVCELNAQIVVLEQGLSGCE